MEWEKAEGNQEQLYSMHTNSHMQHGSHSEHPPVRNAQIYDENVKKQKGA